MYVVMWWNILTCLVIFSVQSLEVTVLKALYKGVSVKCNGLPQQSQILNKSISALGEIEINQFSLQNSEIGKSKLPHCSMWSNRDKIQLIGAEEISDCTVKNAARLLSEFLFDLPIPFPEENYLKLYSTLFQSPNYISAAINWCKVLKTEYKIKCYFIDVIKNPSVLATFMRPVPWMEVHLDGMKSPAIVPEEYPNLWEFKKQQDLVSQDELKARDVELKMDQCIDANCGITLMRDELLYSQEYWKKEISPYKPVKVEYLANTGIAAAPHEVLQLINGEIDGLKSSETVFVIYILDPGDCGSCQNALPELKQLKEHMRKDQSKFYYVDCNKNADFCESQNITGFPTFLTYKIPLIPQNPICNNMGNKLISMNYHGPLLAANLIEWYRDVQDMGVHFSEPHAFHEGCNIHITITTTKDSVDGLPLDCFVSICKTLAFSECFILQDGVNDLFVKTIELKRRDGVTSMIYEDNVPLDISFARTQALHRYHGDHYYNYPPCAISPAQCFTALGTFIQEHSRVPVTELSPIVFHSPTSYRPLFGNLPVLVALVQHETILAESSGFMKALQEVSVKFYKHIATSYVDVDRYPMWVHGMTPVAEKQPSEGSWVFQYPRVLVFELQNHKRAAFCRVVGKQLSGSELTRFVETFLHGTVMETCHGI